MNAVQEGLRNRYATLHPLVFQRSMEKSVSDANLFDLLDGFPQELPVVWDDDEGKWVHSKDLLQLGTFGVPKNNQR